MTTATTYIGDVRDVGLTNTMSSSSEFSLVDINATATIVTAPSSMTTTTTPITVAETTAAESATTVEPMIISTTATTTTTPSNDDHHNDPNLPYIELYHLGNICHMNEQYEIALSYYTNAIKELPTTTTSSSSLLLLYQFRMYGHRSWTYYQLQQYDDAYHDGIIASRIIFENNTLSGIHTNEMEIFWKRWGVVCYHVTKYDESYNAFQRAHQLRQLHHPRDHPSNINKHHHEDDLHDDYIAWMNRILQKRAQEQEQQEQPPPHKTTKNDETTTSATAPSTTTTNAATVSHTTTTTAASASSNSTYVVPKYQYYQNDKYMTIQIMEKQLNSDLLKVDYTDQTITVTIRNPYLQTYVPIVTGKLYDTIIVDECKVIYKIEKTLVKLRKSQSGYEWHELLSKESVSNVKVNAIQQTKSKLQQQSSSLPNDHENPQPMEVDSTISKKIPRPYTSHRDWDSIERDVLLEEKEEKPVGDEAMNRLFEQIYADADPDTRRAMIKSYQTSGGTVLSTNWSEVSSTNYEEKRTAPSGMEWKTWEGQKLPTTDDD